MWAVRLEPWDELNYPDCNQNMTSRRFPKPGKSMIFNTLMGLQAYFQVSDPPFIYGVTCPINNGALNSFVWLRIDFFLKDRNKIGHF